MQSELLDPADSRPGVQRALRDWLALQAVLALRPTEARAALQQHSDPRAVLAGRGRPAPATVDAAVATLSRLGAVAIPYSSPAFPAALAALSDAPPLLLVRGDPALLRAPCVAVVGSRAATAYGRAAARDFAAALAAAGVVVVSGLATGIDAVAHQAALDAGGHTIAVLACGPDRLYPARHRRLAEAIAERGALVTEFPPGTTPRRPFFPLRNRLISGMSLALLVVEARQRSGSLTTAAHAAEQGIDVFAVPGPLGAPASAGTNRLIYDGAQLALGPELLVEHLVTWCGLAPPLPALRRETPAARRGGLCGQILAALDDEPLGRDELGRRLALPPEQLARALLELELEGAIVEERDGRLRVVRLAGGL